ncbi:hypothetical protein J0A94_03870 [Paraclostridium bifermentans]|uniref:Uncharacterized protein n=2 Tax=Paraclostridium bifermentans TaxID=1490 RepID=A0AA44DJR7_PARBF|nr:hypothetical protein [Paraclostridium bifermentans]MBN8046954.1 hypothetical protein [Paraclostridium bifermentans]NME08974.1 hypothetical protein [Paraclostridium bifermentans]
MIFNYIQAKEIYELIFEWLTTKSVAEYARKSDFTKFQKKLWNPILKAIDELTNKEDLSKEEKEFLELTLYRGDIFRVLRYRPRDRRFVFPMEEYQSWSSSIEGLLKIPGIPRESLLLIGKADMGIDIFGLLHFLFKYEYVKNIDIEIYPQKIYKYEKEKEIAYKTSFDKIKKIVVVDKKDLSEHKEKIIKEIPKELWGRKSLR